MKKKILALFVAAMFCVISGSAVALTEEEYDVVRKVSDEFLGNIPDNNYHFLAEDVLKKIQSGETNFILVDLRIPKDKKYDLGHLPGAVHIPIKEITKSEILAKLPKDKDIIVYCDSGHEQNKALTILRMLGYRAYDMKWGYMSWKTAVTTGMTLKAIEGSILNNYPVEK
jgi:rhodanese-related sulfurtransferase